MPNDNIPNPSEDSINKIINKPDLEPPKPTQVDLTEDANAIVTPDTSISDQVPADSSLEQNSNIISDNNKPVGPILPNQAISPEELNQTDTNKPEIISEDQKIAKDIIESDFDNNADVLEPESNKVESPIVAEEPKTELSQQQDSTEQLASTENITQDKNMQDITKPEMQQQFEETAKNEPIEVDQIEKSPAQMLSNQPTESVSQAMSQEQDNRNWFQKLFGIGNKVSKKEDTPHPVAEQAVKNRNFETMEDIAANPKEGIDQNPESKQ